MAACSFCDMEKRPCRVMEQLGDQDSQVEGRDLMIQSLEGAPFSPLETGGYKSELSALSYLFYGSRGSVGKGFGRLWSPGLA